MLSPSSDAQEFGKWLGGTPHELTVTALKPSASNLSLALQLQQLVQTRAPAHGIVITSYDTLLRHGKHLHSGQGLDLLIADEAHCLSHEGVRADAARRTPAAARLLVTATPLSNMLCRSSAASSTWYSPGFWARWRSFGTLKINILIQ